MSYYYLISGLPNLSPDVDTQQIDFNNTFELIRRNLTPEDHEMLKYILFPNDIKNLLSVLFEEYYDLPRGSFNRPSVFSEEAISEYRLSKKEFPDFMNDFLSDNEERFQTLGMREMEESLRGKFHEEIEQLNNTFVIEYLNFYEDVKATIAAYNFNAHEFLSRPSFSDIDRLLGQIGPSRSPASAILNDYPFVVRLIERMSEGQPRDIEKFIDLILWDFLDERQSDLFSSDEVFKYTIRLMIVQRWSLIAQEKGQELFETLHQRIRNYVRSPKTPVI